MSTTSPPDPLRPLGQLGFATWKDLAPLCPAETLHLLQIVCEQIDERSSLRLTVLQQGDPSDRRALRAIDRQIVEGLDVIYGVAQPREAEIDPFDRLSAELSAAVEYRED
jgi:hypothetical protein